jgi:hypothetical protein
MYEGLGPAPRVPKDDMDLGRQVGLSDRRPLSSEIGLKGGRRSSRCSAPRPAASNLAVAATDRKIETLRREVEVVKVNDSVQKAQAQVAAGGAGAGNALGSAAGSLARIKEQQAIRGERIRAAGGAGGHAHGRGPRRKAAHRRIAPGHSSADDVLARLSAPAPAPLAIEDSSKSQA